MFLSVRPPFFFFIFLGDRVILRLIPTHTCIGADYMAHGYLDTRHERNLHARSCQSSRSMINVWFVCDRLLSFVTRLNYSITCSAQA